MLMNNVWHAPRPVISVSEARENFKAVLDRVVADTDMPLMTRCHANDPAPCQGGAGDVARHLEPGAGTRASARAGSMPIGPMVGFKRQESSLAGPSPGEEVPHPRKSPGTEPIPALPRATGMAPMGNDSSGAQGFHRGHQLGEPRPARRDRVHAAQLKRFQCRQTCVGVGLTALQ
jgi:hypothetical protein